MRNVFALALSLFVVGLAAAQQPTQDYIVKLQIVDLKEEQRQRLYEDVEIMRRLLNHGLAKAQRHTDNLALWLEIANPMMDGKKPDQQSGWMDLGLPAAPGPDGRNFKPLFIPDSMIRYWDLSNPQAGPKPAEAEGVYLKGQGVVYTATLPPTNRDPRASSEKAPARPLSDWERTRKQLRGEKLESEAKNEAFNEPSVTDIILKLLAENGHHLSGLPENESLTVVVTFRPFADSKGDVRAAAAQALGQLGGKYSAYKAAANDQELLGDLHLKQGKIEAAIEAFRKAIEQDPKNETLLRKLAAAYLAEGNYDKAKQHIDKAIEFLKKHQDAPTESKSGVSTPLPNKLIVSAPKKLLDQVGAGKISLADFKKEVTVEYVTFPAAEKK